MLRIELRVLVKIIVIKGVAVGRRLIKTLAAWEAGEDWCIGHLLFQNHAAQQTTSKLNGIKKVRIYCSYVSGD